MALKKKIYSVNKEAALYNSQGMYEEALEKYRELLELIKKYKVLKNREDLERKILIKIKGIQKKLAFYKSERPGKEIDSSKKDLIKKLFTDSNEKDPEYNDFQKALTLAKFGQFEDSIIDMLPFLKHKAFRLEAAKNIARCYIKLGKKDEALKLIEKWALDFIISEKEKTSLLLAFSEGNSNIDQKLNLDNEDIVPEEVVENDNLSDSSSDDSYILGDISESDPDSPEIMEINSVGIKLADKENSGGEPVEFDVSFQAGNHLSLIISSREKSMIDSLDVGLKLNDMCFYSPIAVFKSSGIVLSKHQIPNGPKKGDWCLDIEIKNPT